jgi:hypothetical protein
LNRPPRKLVGVEFAGVTGVCVVKIEGCVRSSAVKQSAADREDFVSDSLPQSGGFDPPHR